TASVPSAAILPRLSRGWQSAGSPLPQPVELGRAAQDRQLDVEAALLARLERGQRAALPLLAAAEAPAVARLDRDDVPPVEERLPLLEERQLGGREAQRDAEAAGQG